MSAETKLELLGLVDSAVQAGWAHVRACRVLQVEDVRVYRWRRRLAEHGTLADRPPVGNAVHLILPEEEQAILELIEEWAWVDRSHRKLAHRGSYVGKVFVSPSTLLRVALKHRIELPGEPIRPRPPEPAFPEIAWDKNRIWIWDASHFTRCKRVAYAIIDVVTRYWIAYLLTVEQTSTQAQLLFAQALEDQGLLGPDGLPISGDHDGPILVAWSDNGSEMTASDTRGFMALMTIAQHPGPLASMVAIAVRSLNLDDPYAAVDQHTELLRHACSLRLSFTPRFGPHDPRYPLVGDADQPRQSPTPARPQRVL